MEFRTEETALFPGLPCAGNRERMSKQIAGIPRPAACAGNKSRIVNTVLSVMPKHTVCMEPCMGSTQAFFRKPKQGAKK